MDELITRWLEEIGGSYSEYEQPEGFCTAACQYWLTESMRGRSDRDITTRLRAWPERISLRHQHLRGYPNEIPGTTRAVCASPSRTSARS